MLQGRVVKNKRLCTGKEVSWIPEWDIRFRDNCPIDTPPEVYDAAEPEMHGETFKTIRGDHHVIVCKECDGNLSMSPTAKLWARVYPLGDFFSVTDV